MDFFHKGILQDSILCFEAIVQRDPQNSDAWRWLGSAHAENDEDKR
jgi:peroxin-5